MARLFLSTYFIIQLIFATIHGFYCTISANFYIYLQYFQQKVFSFSKINRSQTDPKIVFDKILTNDEDIWGFIRNLYII